MIKNYWRVAIRNLARYKGYSFINIAGLATGIAAALLLFLVIAYEKSYDTFQPKYSSIYHVVTEDKYPEDIDYTSGVPYPALDALRLDFPEVKMAGISSTYGSQVTVMGNDSIGGSNNKKFIESTGIFYLEPQFFEVFSYSFLAGSADALKDPNTVVLSRSAANKYFTDWKNAMGQYIKVDNVSTLKVGGVIEDVPFNTDFPLHVLASYETFKQSGLPFAYTSDWGSTNSNFNVYMQLPPNVTAENINARLKKFNEKYYQVTSAGNRRSNSIRPLSDVHFDTRFSNYGDHVTNLSTLRTLSLIGILIIIMACINFINLSTAQAISRSKEVGVRKVMGGTRWQLFWQMMSETALIVFFAMIAAVVIAYLCVPFLRYFVSLQEKINLFTATNVLFLLVTGLIVTLLSGAYPSLILSGFKPALALKNKITSAKVGKISLRRGLVVTQFGISQVLIMGTIVAVSQMNYIRNADLGFNKESILVLNTNADSAVVARQTAFKADLLNTAGVQSVSFSSDVPSSDNNWSTNFAYDNREDEKYSLFIKYGDADYLKTYGLQLAAGRMFEPSDTIREVLINETLVKKLGVSNVSDVIGKSIRTGRSQWKTIVGVVKDFKANSLREEVNPIMISTRKKFYGTTGIKFKTQNISQLQETVQRLWDKHFPEYVNSASFMDENINRFYQQENQMSLLYKVFAGLAIFISCLGLYGLVSFMAVQKTKEIGIRKVLGASVGNIVYLFSKEFTVLIGVAFIIAAPIAWYMMTSWLENFVFKINIGAGVFLIAVCISIVIAWITVGYKAVRAAIVNPVKSLKSE